MATVELSSPETHPEDRRIGNHPENNETPRQSLERMIGDIRSFLARPAAEDPLILAQHLLLRPSLLPEALERHADIRQTLEDLRQEVWMKVVRTYLALLEGGDVPLPSRVIAYGFSALSQAEECGMDVSPERAKFDALITARQWDVYRKARWHTHDSPAKGNGKASPLQGMVG